MIPHLLKSISSMRVLIGIAILSLFVFGYWHWLAYDKTLNSAISSSFDFKSVTVSPGTGINKLALKWQKQKLISSHWYLRIHARLNAKGAILKSGEYAIESNDSPLSLFKKIIAGQVIQYEFAIIEGVNSFQLLEQIAGNPLLINDIPEDPSQLLRELGLTSPSIEGWLFPDTYYIAKGSSALALLKRANDRMKKVLEEEWAKRSSDLPYQTPYEALIMASIIEKETGVASERDMIAGVFVRRLRKKMRLQTDPTVIYGIGPEFNGDITYKNLREATPYNTYVIKGMPPTPIAMAGREAIHAALNPLAGEALYFVATGDGGHYFSSTLKEHNAAVRKYQMRK